MKTSPMNEFAADGPYLSREQKARGIVDGWPEVVFRYDCQSTGNKICTESGLRDAARYIARNGNLDVENELGMILASKESVDRTVEGWGCDETQEFDDDRIGHRLKLSIKGSPLREPFEAAVRVWGSEHLKGHPFILGFHYDTSNAHAHILLRARSLSTGKQFSVQGRQDAERLRESLAAKLLERGIQANATRRYTRGIFKMRKNGGEIQQEKRRQPQPRMECLIKHLVSEGAAFFRAGISVLPHASVLKARGTREQVVKFAKDYAGELSRTGDPGKRELAQKLVAYYDSLQRPEMEQEEVVKQLDMARERRNRQWQKEDEAQIERARRMEEFYRLEQQRQVVLERECLRTRERVRERDGPER